ncbi:MAG: nucleoside monophosphate kinase [bacterium]
MKILFLGPLFSGKDTQANFLTKKYHLPLIATGNLLREQVVKKTKLGKKVASFLDEGSLVPDNLVLGLIKNRLKKEDARKGFVLDGFPRDLIQARGLEKVTKLDYVFELKLSDKEVLKRVAGRRTCLCGLSYHLKFNPSKKKNICDKCGRKLFIRADDKPSIVKKRLKIFKKNTISLRKFYQKQKIYHVINGNQPIKKIHRDIIKIIKNF